MTNHIRRLQYQQQQQHLRQAARDNGSVSSFRTGDPSNYEISLRDDGSIFPGNSMISDQTDVINIYDNLGGGSRSYLSGPSMQGPLSAMNPPSIMSLEAAYPRLNDRRGLGSMGSYNASTVAGRSLLSRPSLYAKSNLYKSRSLGASKASLVTAKSGRSTIQAEHHDRKVQLLINAVDFQKARKPYFWSIFFFTMFLLTLFVGLLVICLRHVYMNIFLSIDIGESIGPLLCAGSFLFFGAGMKFLYDAYQIGARERMQIKYQPASASTVAVKIANAPAVDATEELISGKTTDKALSRAPIGTRMVNPSVLSY